MNPVRNTKQPKYKHKISNGMNNRIRLKEAVRFHGHLGPYLVLGLLAGETALKKLKLKKYFDLKVNVWGAGKKPKSCLVDGLQLSTGATYGKGNIHKFNGKVIKIIFYDKEGNENFSIRLKKVLIKKLDSLKNHKDCEEFAKKLYRKDISNVFHLSPIT